MRTTDIAFVPMNLPYTMTEEQAATGVNAFDPDVVSPITTRAATSRNSRHSLRPEGETPRFVSEAGTRPGRTRSAGFSLTHTLGAVRRKTGKPGQM